MVLWLAKDVEGAENNLGDLGVQFMPGQGSFYAQLRIEEASNQTSCSEVMGATLVV